jgi:hypothetical protein
MTIVSPLGVNWLNQHRGPWLMNKKISAFAKNNVPELLQLLQLKPKERKYKQAHYSLCSALALHSTRFAQHSLCSELALLSTRFAQHSLCSALALISTRFDQHSF